MCSDLSVRLGSRQQRRRLACAGVACGGDTGGGVSAALVASKSIKHTSSAHSPSFNARRKGMRKGAGGSKQDLNAAHGNRVKNAVDKELVAAHVLQEAIRHKIIQVAKTRLNRRNLAERLLFESSVLWETARFVNQVLVFAFLLLSLKLSSNELQKRGSFNNLKEAFDFEALSSITSRQNFVIEGLPLITAASKDYFLLSSNYFDDNGAGSKQLIRDVVSFSAPVSSGQLTLSGLEFSLTAWVKTGPNFLKGYILQKPTGHGHSCWGWHLHRVYGPELHYGGHDYFQAPPDFPPSQSEKQQQIEIGLSTREGFPSGHFALLTMAVTPADVTFYHNTRKLDTVMLPAPLSDCFNDGTGILLGHGGMEIADLRFHPTALTENGIEELFFNGGALGDLASGSQPELYRVSEIEALDGSMTASLARGVQQQAARKVSTDINFVIDRIESQPASTHQSPPAPTGTINANPDSLRDAGLDRSYHSLYMGPGRLTRTDQSDHHRYIEGQPSFLGTGATLSFWYRHRQCDDPKDTCGLFMLSAFEEGPTDQTKCWTLWLEKSKMWFDNPNAIDGNPVSQYPAFGFSDRFNLAGDTFWRHLAMVFNEQTDEVEFYIDGTFVVKEIWGSAVTTASCATSNPRIAFGSGGLDWTYGGVVEAYDFRMYVHGSAGPLGESAIRRIAQADTPGLNAQHKCVAGTDPQLEDKEFVDVYGHDCSWYGENARTFPAVCSFAQAGEMCPISCSRRQECWMTPEPMNAHYSWSGIRRIEPSLDSPAGALCRSDAESREEMVDKCKAWVAGGLPDMTASEWYNSYKKEGGTEDALGNRLDLRDCDRLAAAVTESCTINSTAVKAFTRESEEHNGDWTLAFWMRPVGAPSLVEETKTFIPHLQFLSTLSPPSHNLALGLYANPNGEARFFSACGEATEKFDNVEFKAASADGWTFFAVTRTNAKEGAGAAQGTGTTLTNVGKNKEGSPWKRRQCLFNPEAFFTTLEVNYPVLMSPIMMIPSSVPVSGLQRLFQESVADMRTKSGAASSSPGGAIPIEKATFAQPLILVAPPILFQTRSYPAQACPSKFGKLIIENQHSQMLKSQCAFPFVCDEELRASPAKLLACAGDEVKDEIQFGLVPSDFQGRRGYADFLASVTEPIFLFRSGQLFETQDFVDTLTQTVQVLLVFWNPEASITTVVTVSADFATSSSAQVDVSVEHYELLEGTKLNEYLIVQILVLINVSIMVIDIFFNLKTTILKVVAARKEEAEEEAAKKQERDERRAAQRAMRTMSGTSDISEQIPQSAIGAATANIKNLFGPKAILGIIRDVLKSFRELLKDLVDAVIALLVVVYVAERIPTKKASAAETEASVGALSKIEWGSTALQREAKVEAFFEAMNDLGELIAAETNLNNFCNFVLLLSLLRLIKCTGMHPRLALLEGTLSKAWDDLWHAAILIVLLMLCFAGIGTWRFGGFRQDFADYEASCQTLFQMTFGEFPEYWTETRDLQLYTVAYFMLVFLLVQNFLLAVIVEAYMGVRKDNEELETEQEFIQDIFSSFQSHWLAYRRGWPTPYKLGEELELWDARRSLGFQDLWDIEWFRDRASVVGFINHYRAFDFLAPVPFDEYGPTNKNEQEQLAKDLELRLAKSMGIRIQTLKEFAQEQLNIASARRGVSRALWAGVVGQQAQAQAATAARAGAPKPAAIADKSRTPAVNDRTAPAMLSRPPYLPPTVQPSPVIAVQTRDLRNVGASPQAPAGVAGTGVTADGSHSAVDHASHRNGVAVARDAASLVPAEGSSSESRMGSEAHTSTFMSLRRLEQAESLDSDTTARHARQLPPGMVSRSPQMLPRMPPSPLVPAVDSEPDPEPAAAGSDRDDALPPTLQPSILNDPADSSRRRLPTPTPAQFRPPPVPPADADADEPRTPGGSVKKFWESPDLGQGQPEPEPESDSRGLQANLDSQRLWPSGGPGASGRAVADLTFSGPGLHVDGAGSAPQPSLRTSGNAGRGVAPEEPPAHPSSNPRRFVGAGDSPSIESEF